MNILWTYVYFTCSYLGRIFLDLDMLQHFQSNVPVKSWFYYSHTSPQTPFKNWPCVTSCPCGGISKYTQKSKNIEGIKLHTTSSTLILKKAPVQYVARCVCHLVNDHMNVLHTAAYNRLFSISIFSIFFHSLSVCLSLVVFFRNIFQAKLLFT